MATRTWLAFDEVEQKGRKTRVWMVQNAVHGAPLGTVKWWGPWRGYTFFTNGYDSVWHPDCLAELADFCRKQTHLHRVLGRAVEWSTEDVT